MSKKLIPLLILAAGILGFMALKMTRPEPAAVNATERSWRVEIQKVEPGTHTPVLPLYGQVVAPEQLTVRATLAGRIGERPVAEGQRVREGELLVALDSADIEPALAQAESQVNDLQAQIRSEEVRYRNDQRALASEQAILENARRQLERTRSLVNRELASREALEAASDAAARAELAVTTRQRAIDEHPARLQSLEARLAQARASLDSTRRDAGRARVVAPFDGIVTDIQVATGDRVSGNQALLSLYPVTGLELRARVPERYLGELQAALARGDTLTATTAGETHRFRLVRFAGTSDPSGTEAILELAGEPDGIRPGALVPVTLERAARDRAVAIPFTALYGADSVYLMSSDGRMERATIQRIGEVRSADGERRMLVAGDELVSGARLITTHLPNAVTGLKVDVADAGDSAQ
jgi:multidrug efflux pump subunit AcrA (membrane-fusion protein)